MIKLKCSHSKKIDFNFEVTFNQNFITFGSQDSNDFVLNDINANKIHLSLEVKKDAVFIYPSKLTSSFFHNSNKTVSIKRVFPKDTFSIGTYQFEILETSFTELLDVRKIINEQTEKVLAHPTYSKRIKEIHERI